MSVDFWCNPIFDDDDVLRMYKSFLIKAGRCPVCNDFLFVEINALDGGGFCVVKVCVSHDCSYSLDVSREFNACLGLDVDDVDVMCVGFDDEGVLNRDLVSCVYYAGFVECGSRNAFGYKIQK